MSNTNLRTQSSSVLQNHTVSSCSTSKVQEKTQLSRIKCMNSLRAIQSQLKFLIETLQDFGNMPIFKRTFSQDLDLLENHLTKEIISQTDCKTTLTKLRTTFENAFSSEIKARMQNYTRYDAQSFYDAMIFNMDSLGKYMLELILHQQRTLHLLKQKTLMQTQEDHSKPISTLNVDSLKVDLVVIRKTCSEKEDSNSETASSKSVKECSLNSETKDVHAIKYKMSKAKERCMAYFRSLHSHLQVLSKGDSKGTRIEHGFKQEFMSLFGQDFDTFTRTMLLNADQLQKQLDKDEFQEDGSMTTFWVKSIAERTRHQRQYERRVNKRQMQTQESKIDTGKALDTDLVDIESIRLDSTVQDDNSRPGNDANNADIRPIYDKEPMVEVQLTAECNIFTIEQQHTEQSKIINEGRVDQYPEKWQVKSPMLDSLPDNQTTEYSELSKSSHRHDHELINIIELNFTVNHPGLKVIVCMLQGHGQVKPESKTIFGGKFARHDVPMGPSWQAVEEVRTAYWLLHSTGLFDPTYFKQIGDVPKVVFNILKNVFFCGTTSFNMKFYLGGFYRLGVELPVCVLLPLESWVRLFRDTQVFSIMSGQLCHLPTCVFEMRRRKNLPLPGHIRVSSTSGEVGSSSRARKALTSSRRKSLSPKGVRVREEVEMTLFLI
ncbi:hypothetical protein Tco_0138134 [Tanacetum coccineum]